jgi:formylglycine-generating enzyme required for sulfatase activity
MNSVLAHSPDRLMSPEMVVIQPGHFWMGADDELDKFSSAVEKPRHRVEIDYSFAVGRCPVTAEQWNAYTGGDDVSQLPVVNVSWDDATGYVEWLSAQTGLPFRLPSESEWEYCCRAGTDTVFGTGNSISIKDANFLYLDFGDRPGVGRPVEVGSYPPNAFGLYDMHGNVCELVADTWHSNYLETPTNGSFRPGSGPWRVVRGGGWDGLPRVLRSAFRDWIRRDQRMDNVGFRVACDLK